MAYQKLFNILSKQYNVTYIDSEIVNDIINVCREIIAKENEAPKSIYQVGDTVYYWEYGEGNIYCISHEENKLYPVFVNFGSIVLQFTIDGKINENHKKPSLSFTPYDLVNGGFSQERPKPEPKIGDWGYFWDKEDDHCNFDCIATIFDNNVYKYSTKHSDEKYKFFSSDIPEHIKKQMK